MRWFRSGFRRGLDSVARRYTFAQVVDPSDPREGLSRTMSFDSEIPFFRIEEENLGRLCALLIVQAEHDGASRMQIRFSENRLVYTIAAKDYEMVPMLSPGDADLCRLLARESGTCYDAPGTLDLRFRDRDVALTVEYFLGMAPAFPQYVELRGFSGGASDAPA